MRFGFYKYFFHSFFVMLLVGCGHLSSKVDVYHQVCGSKLVEAEIIECYNLETSLMLARKVVASTRRLTDGDWPHAFQMLIQLNVEKTGQFKIASIYRSSGSRKLDKKIIHALNNVGKIYVPDNALFNTVEYSRLRLLFKPARTPLLGSEQLVDDGALVVYLNKVRR